MVFMIEMDINEPFTINFTKIKNRFSLKKLMSGSGRWFDTIKGNKYSYIYRYRKIYNIAGEILGIHIIFSEDSEIDIFQKKIYDLIISNGYECNLIDPIIQCYCGKEANHKSIGIFKCPIYDRELSAQNQKLTLAVFINENRKEETISANNIYKILHPKTKFIAKYNINIYSNDNIILASNNIINKNIVIVRFIITELIIDNTNIDVPNTIYKVNWHKRKEFALFRAALLHYCNLHSGEKNKISTMVFYNRRLARHIASYL